MDKKVSFVRVDEYRELVRSSEFMKTCHNVNIIFQTTGGDASSLNGKSESPNKTLANITRALILNSNHKKEIFFAYHYDIWISCLTKNIFCGGVT